MCFDAGTAAPLGKGGSHVHCPAPRHCCERRLDGPSGDGTRGWEPHPITLYGRGRVTKP